MTDTENKNVQPIRIQAVGSKGICRSCGRPIVWLKTMGGKSMPCDNSPVYYREEKHSKTKIVTPGGVVVSGEIVTNTPDKATGFGYIPHWSTCDAPEKFRKGKTK